LSYYKNGTNDGANTGTPVGRPRTSDGQMKAELETDQEQMMAETKAGYEEMITRLEAKMGSLEFMVLMKASPEAKEASIETGQESR
jgi:hypothetical protein